MEMHLVLSVGVRFLPVRKQSGLSEGGQMHYLRGPRALLLGFNFFELTGPSNRTEAI